MAGASGRVLLSLAAGVLLVGAVGAGQQTTAPIPGGATRPGIDRNDEPALPPGFEQKQQALRESDRQRRLVADTDKLLALATQLHTDVGKTDKNILSLDVVKRADEIEKLAKSIKERMKG